MPRPLSQQSSILATTRMDKMTRFQFEEKMIRESVEFSTVIGVGRTRLVAESTTFELAMAKAIQMVSDSGPGSPNHGKHAMVYAGPVYVGKVNSKGMWEERKP